MPDNPARVGIVVRTQHRPWFLRRALQDIAQQTYGHWRAHIVNDGGERADVDAAVAALPESIRSRVDITHNDHARGRSTAANQGVTALGTPYVVLHDDDDLWAPGFLAATVTWLDEHQDDAGVVAPTEIVYEVEDPSAPGRYIESGRAPFFTDMTDVLLTDLLVMNRIVPIAYLYRRSLHDDVGLYRDDIHAAEDWEFHLRTAVAHRIGVLGGEPLAFWMQRVGVGGQDGNSMFALAEEHGRYDARIRDEALRAFVARFGAGLPLYLARQLQTEIARTVREEVARELDRRPSDLQRIAQRLRLRRRPRE